MKSDFEIYEDRYAAHAREQRVGPRAGIFLLHGRYHVANHLSLLARTLVADGAIHVASVTFDGISGGREAAGGSVPSGAVRLADLHPLPSRGAAQGPAESLPSHN